METSPDDFRAKANDFIYTRGNYKRENVKIRDIYDFRPKRETKKRYFVRKDAIKKLTKEELEERTYTRDLLKDNAFRNKSVSVDSNGEENEDGDSQG
jgi:hypothetical protein